MYSAIRGFTAIPTLPFYRAILSTDLLSLESDFKIPIYFFQGAEDQASLVQEYFEEIHAPHKELVLFEGEGHFVVWTKHERFLRELVARVRPLAAQP